MQKLRTAATKAAAESKPSQRGLDLGGIVLAGASSLPAILGALVANWTTITELLIVIGIVPEVISKLGAAVTLAMLVYTAVTKGENT